jgi:FAD/FMN-containing dehydrogenase
MAGMQVAAMGETTALDDEVITTFGQGLRGNLLRPGDPDYDEACRINNAIIERRPALIVRCIGAADVSACVNFARTHGLLVSVRGGGHNVAGSALAEGGLDIDLTLVNNVRVDPVARTVRAGGGATWGDVYRETQLFGLATPGGVVSTTGVGGLTLGGGLGHLRRRYGTSCENLVSVDIVTADGRLLRAGADVNRDLFWGVRGGGGNFGVVTSFEFRLHPVGPLVAMAATIYPFEEAEAILRGWRTFMATAPDEISSTALFASMAPLPFVPVEQHGRPVVIVSAVYAGEAGDGARALQPLRILATPIADLSATLPTRPCRAPLMPPSPTANCAATGSRSTWTRWTIRCLTP